MQNAETVLGVLRERGRRGLPLDELNTHAVVTGEPDDQKWCAV